jgi:hypothetical protein
MPLSASALCDRPYRSPYMPMNTLHFSTSFKHTSSVAACSLIESVMPQRRSTTDSSTSRTLHSLRSRGITCFTTRSRSCTMSRNGDEMNTRSSRSSSEPPTTDVPAIAAAALRASLSTLLSALDGFDTADDDDAATAPPTGGGISSYDDDAPAPAPDAPPTSPCVAVPELYASEPRARERYGSDERFDDAAESAPVAPPPMGGVGNETYDDEIDAMLGGAAVSDGGCMKCTPPPPGAGSASETGAWPPVARSM